MEALQRLHNRGSISTGYDIDNSLKLEADNNEYLIKANDSGTNRKTFTVSMWFKRTELANDYMQLWQGGANGEATRLGFYGGTPKEAIWVDIGGGSGNTGTLSRSYSNQVLRDTSAFYHIVLAVDTTQATEANRWKLWLNGEEVTSWGARNYPAQDFQCAVEASINMHWGAYSATYYKTCGYIAECHYLDGVAKVQTDFGEYDEDSGIWIPKAYTGTYGGNGCYLNFDDSSALGADSSGNGNTFTLNNITAADQATDTPTNNFSTLNPLIEQGLIPARYTVSEGGTKQISTADGYGCSVGTIGVSKGKWYFEAQFDSDGSGKHFGVIDEASFTTGTAFVDGISPGQQAYGVSIFKNGGINIDGSYVPSYSFSSFTTETLGCAMDLDNNKLYFSKSGTYGNSGDPTSGATGTGAIPLSTAGGGTWFISTGCYTGHALTNQGGYTSYTISSAASDANGYGTFEYAPPSGYYALCTKNLEEFG